MVERRKAPKGCYWRGDTLWGRFEIQGVEYRRSLRTNETKIAEGRLKAARDKIIADRRFGETRATWQDAVLSWGAAITSHTKPSTAKRYMVSLTQLEPFLVGLNVDEIDKKLISTIIQKRRTPILDDKGEEKKPGATNATIRRDLVALSSVLTHAEEEGWRTDNPALARMRSLKERRDPIVLPEPADIETVIALAPGRFADLIRVAWLTGCRQDELRRMERKHLNFGRSQISIYRTKTGRPRVIDMHDAETVLARIPPKLGSEVVFWHSNGEPYLNISSNFRRLVGSARKSAQKAKRDFRPFRFHDLRHRFAVDFLKSGGGIYDLSRHLGHTSVKTTEIYLAYLTASEADEARKGSAQKPAREQRFCS